MIGFAVIDFAMSFMGINLTSFLGSVEFSPIVFGLIGGALLNKIIMNQRFALNYSNFFEINGIASHAKAGNYLPGYTCDDSVIYKTNALS